MTRFPTRTVRPVRDLPQRPVLSSVATGVAFALSAFSIDAGALSLGRLNVLSALGEPLRAEVELTDISAAEAEGLKVGIPSSEAFRAIGVPYNAVLADVQARLQRRAGGRYVVQLSSSRQMTEPFIDVLLEASGNSGRVFRDYTVLIDPPGNRPGGPVSSAAVVVPLPVPRELPSIGASRETSSSETRRPRPAAVERAVAPAPVERAVPRGDATVARRSSGVGGNGGQVTVRPGDTASRIANAHRPAEISLDQMLVAMMRSNPAAFSDGNLNRLRAGAVIDLPDASQAGALPASEARSAVIALSRDFNDYRSQLAASASAASPVEAGRQASGKLQPGVEARNAAAPSDRLTVAPSGPAVAATAASAANQAISPSSAATTPAAGVAPGASAGGWPAVVSPDAAAVLSSPSASAAGATVPRTSAAAKRAITPPVAAAGSDAAWYDVFLGNPLLTGGLALLGLLLAWLAYRLAGRRRNDAAESIFLESNLPKDSFFAVSGGESVDTRHRGSSLASSLTYSPSQLDASDVDPVAEADVYLAYGRDLQAEEILREALRANPDRVAIHLKLLEIHAKRRDLRAYEGLAGDVRELTGGTGSEWARVMEMGKELDPNNPAYDASIRPSGFGAIGPLVAATGATAPPGSATATVPPAAFATQSPAFVPSVAPLDFDLDLDKPPATPPPAGPLHVPPQPAAPVTASLPDLPPISAAAAASAPTPFKPQQRFVQTMRETPRVLPSDDPPTIDLDHDFATGPVDLDLPFFTSSTSDVPTDFSTLRANLPDDSGLIDFDIREFSGARPNPIQDTERADIESPRQSVVSEDDPQAIKLSLARELQALGDTEGARSLIEEVEAESSGELRAQAKRLRAQLG